MMNKYFADVNDYTKYCILRQFADIPKIIYWMLTTSGDDGNYLRRLKYLELPECADLDKELWDHLKNCVAKGWRNVSYIEGWLGNVVHYEKRPIDNWAERKKISHEVISMAGGGQIVFLDPDNGYEVQSVSKSSKHVYKCEIEKLLEKEATVILFQHLRRGQPADKMIAEFSGQWSGQYRFAVRTSYAVYYFLSKHSDLDWARQKLAPKQNNRPHIRLKLI